jgi:FKBP-type peptidyl-prolyl cis-trans isomerase
VKYKGYLTNNQVFDETVGNNSIEFSLSGLIPGWQIGIPLLQRGGKGVFYLPSALGYGSRYAGTIPPNSVLIFDIELLNFD